MADECSLEWQGVLKVRHALMVYTSPRVLFSRVEDTGAYGLSLIVLLGLTVLIGYAEVKTGLIDRGVDQQTEASLAQLEKNQGNLVDRVELRERMADLRKGAEFNKLLARLGVIVFQPTVMLASYLLIASMLYALVALTGRSPEYHTLMSICVYAGFIELVGYVVRLSMVVFYKTAELDTSLAMLAAPGKASLLVGIDPFRIWFWVLIAMGLAVTRQLSLRKAIAVCALMGLLASAARVGLDFAMQA